MNTLTCPHCRSDVPHGATVCRGCQAEIEYGTPPLMYLVLFAISLFFSMKVSAVLPGWLSFLNWFIGIGSFVAGTMLMNKWFKDRVNFKRIYRTR